MLFYLFFFFLGFSNFFFFWFIFSVISLKMMSFISDFENKMKYFVIQEVGILIFFIFFFNELKYLFFLPLFMKMGMPPFFSWLLEIFWKSVKKEFIYFVSFIKIFPSVLIVILISSSHTILFGATYIWVAIYSFFFFFNFKNFFFFSSLMNFLLIFFLSIFNFFFFSFFFLVFYIFSMFYTVFLSANKKMNNFNIGFLMFSSGVPPSPFFFLKFIVLAFFVKISVFFFFIMFFNMLFYFFYLNFMFKLFKSSSHFFSLTNEIYDYFMFVVIMFFIFFL